MVNNNILLDSALFSAYFASSNLSTCLVCKSFELQSVTMREDFILATFNVQSYDVLE